MGRMIIDAATSMDGFCADARGQSIIPIEALNRADLRQPLVSACGAVVMSRRSFDTVTDPDWFADNYELQVPIFVVSDDSPPARYPKENERLRFHFLDTFTEAFERAEQAAGEKAVLAIGEASTVQAALLSGMADEMWLRVIAKETGGGTPLFGPGKPGKEFFVSAVETTPGAVHMKLERRVEH
ncbi:dihydrofolate reductase family protein [Novosphingobium pentaromativorans]|nr:riboflavin biosynthesis protein RibD [Novosphingobium pentaromativorans]AIT79539.1 riboflavin biosynthesis protein RibD [Novosphingobium pentaromativorans US6-1]